MTFDVCYVVYCYGFVCLFCLIFNLFLFLVGIFGPVRNVQLLISFLSVFVLDGVWWFFLSVVFNVDLLHLLCMLTVMMMVTATV